MEKLGRASALWSEGGRVFVGRDTRGSGPELEEAFGRGIASAGGNAVLAGVLPTPAVALLALDLGAVISASHNPPQYNGVKFFDGKGQKLTDRSEEEIEALLDSPPADVPGSIDRVGVATDSYLEHIVERFGTDLGGLRIAVDCANGAYSGIAPEAFERLGAEVAPVAAAPDGRNINVGCGATDLSLLQGVVKDGGYDLGIAFDGDGDRMLAVDAEGEAVDGDQILAVLALDLGVELVAVTVMTNLGFHRLMGERGIEVVVTDVGDRYVLEALRERQGSARRRAVGTSHLPEGPRDGRRPRRGAPPVRRAQGPDAPGGRRRDAPLPPGPGECAGCHKGVAAQPARGGRPHQRGTGRTRPNSRQAVRYGAGRARPRRSRGFP